MTDSERRSFFRINSEIALDFHSVSTQTLEQGNVEEEFPLDQQALDLFNQFRRLDKEAAPLLSGIAEFNRGVADYLSLLNKKMDLLAQQSLAGDYLNKDVRPTHVNLSEGGLAFNCGKALYKGSSVALRMMFLPDYTAVASFATVIRCDSNEQGGYKVACKFVQLTSAKQEILAKQILQAQMAKRRKHRETSEDDHQ
ncbi:PilZ domain-containing protein [Pseudomaricurvus alkylphenolicus]|jgi:hypothetical protein|uniref:PilZ domain-containing protein n=1 Tax=Pseudomaricurvus alkylphenolicus TaxID=1306991 RepID=UPI001420835B|nr:PilZ domain-containing protein [Pseudomaricurvus alkylphenolicus]NIB41265.1 PilZ domain-containing protein [Pseudomaricurvus alkylphenolicus]